MCAKVGASRCGALQLSKRRERHTSLSPSSITIGGRAMSHLRHDDATSGASSHSSGSSSGAILLVDATPSAPTLAAVLRHDGYTVRRVASPQEAQDALKRAQFDLTLVDMPEESAAARTLLARLRNMESAPICIVLGLYASLDT